VDGNLDADWTGAAWTPLNKTYDGNGAPDVTQAFYAARWSADKVYVAVKVLDTAHSFGSDYGTWYGRDAVEIYLHTTGADPDLNYHANQETTAQQYVIGIKPGTTNQVWASLTDTNAMPTEAGFQAAGKINGDWIYYEVAMTPFEYFGGLSGQPNILSPLHAGDQIGLDVCVVGNDGTANNYSNATPPMAGYTGMKSANLMPAKFAYWENLQVHPLGPMLQIPGDANTDGKVDVSDLGILAANYGTTAGATWGKGDFNHDGKVDVSDLGILAANYGTGTGATLDFNKDARALGLTIDGEAASAKADTPATSVLGCGSVGLPLIAGLALMGLMLVKLEE
jgi:hypothetical protein